MWIGVRMRMRARLLMRMRSSLPYEVLGGPGVVELWEGVEELHLVYWFVPWWFGWVRHLL